MFEELAPACTRLEYSADLRCGVLYAEGDHFTAGPDLPTIAPLRQQGKPLSLPALVDLVASIKKVFRHPQRYPRFAAGCSRRSGGCEMAALFEPSTDLEPGERCPMMRETFYLE